MESAGSRDERARPALEKQHRVGTLGDYVGSQPAGPKAYPLMKPIIPMKIRTPWISPCSSPPDVEVGATAWALHLCRQICVRESGAEGETAEQLLGLRTASSNNWSTLHSAGMEARAASRAEP